MGAPFALRWVENAMVATDRAVWGYWRLRGDGVDVTDRALAGLAVGQLLLVREPWPIRRWAASLDGATVDPAPGWYGYLDAVAGYLHSRAVSRPAAFVGVRIATPERTERPGPDTGMAPEATDLAWWRTRLEEVGRLLGSAGLAVRPAWADELRWLVEIPDGSVRHHRDHLIVKGDAGREYVALLEPERIPPAGGDWLRRYQGLEGDIEAVVGWEPGEDGTLRTWPRFVVRAGTAGELDALADDLVVSYRAVGIELVRPRGQAALFWETRPGGPAPTGPPPGRCPAGALYRPASDSCLDLGDRRGPYVGTTGASWSTPVCFDPLRSRPEDPTTTVAVAGGPGEGKTSLAHLLVYQMLLRGASVVVVDHNGDAKAILDLPGTAGGSLLELGEGHAGLLDPFRLGEGPGQSAVLAAGVLTAILSGRQDPPSADAVLAAASAEAAEPSPSLLRALQRCDPRSLFHIDPDGPGWQLLAGSGGERPAMEAGAGQATVISLSTSQQPAGIAAAVALAATAWTQRLVGDRPPGVPTALVVDQAGAVTTNPVGRALLRRVARPPLDSLILVSRLSANLAGLGPYSGWFSFRPTDGADDDARLGSLRNGQCLFSDRLGRRGVLDVDVLLAAPALSALGW